MRVVVDRLLVGKIIFLSEPRVGEKLTDRLATGNNPIAPAAGLAVRLGGGQRVVVDGVDD